MSTIEHLAPTKIGSQALQTEMGVKLEKLKSTKRPGRASTEFDNHFDYAKRH